MVLPCNWHETAVQTTPAARAADEAVCEEPGRVEEKERVQAGRSQAASAGRGPGVDNATVLELDVHRKVAVELADLQLPRVAAGASRDGRQGHSDLCPRGSEVRNQSAYVVPVVSTICSIFEAACTP